MNRRVGLIILVLALLFGTLPGCSQEPENLGPQFGTEPSSSGVSVYHFAIHPLYNPAKLMAAYQPLIDYLNDRLQGARLTLEASRDYANFEEKYGARTSEFLLPNPWQTLQAMQVGYRVIAWSESRRISREYSWCAKTAAGSCECSS